MRNQIINFNQTLKGTSNKTKKLTLINYLLRLNLNFIKFVDLKFVI